MQFKEIGVLLEGYEFWLYENKSQTTLKKIDQEDKSITSRFSTQQALMNISLKSRQQSTDSYMSVNDTE